MSSPSDDFSSFLAAIRQGDEAAASALVAEFAPLLRREVRMRLQDPRLQRVLDASDVCQSVLASFFVRAAAGQFELNDSRSLVGLLINMARNKAAAVARGQHRQKRDLRRNEPILYDRQYADQHQQTPSELVAMEEIRQKFDASLSEEERHAMQLRREGRSWQEIAERLGGTADARRVQLARAADRVCAELGLD